MTPARICEACQKKFAHPRETGDGEMSGEALTAKGQQGIINGDVQSARHFYSLCPRCREEAWDEETLSLPSYPYRH